ncbi:MAG: MarC family protein, partial [Alteromonadaceae bacterium]|nr:MarC family protein [Alteromonadaceae bacterium]
MDLSALITTFVTLLIVLDPFALAPLFLALTRGMSPAMRRSVAVRACLMGAGLLCVFGAFGEAVLGFIGISMPAFRIAGGILLFLTALDMLFERRTARREGTVEQDDHDDPSIFPLSIPLIAGPGAIATVILLTGENEGATGL